MTDDELAADFVARRPQALEAAYRAYAPTLYSVARQVLGNDSDAQDCVHDALMRVWGRTGAFRPERGSLRTFLSVCVRNEAIGRRREAARHFHIEQRLALDEPERPYEFEVRDHVELGRLRDALTALPPEQRQALELAYFQYLSHTQISEKLGVPLGTIKSRLAMGLRKLQDAMPAQPAGTT